MLLKLKLGGFTLAEVLITLGIIGVVAAMTIPTLIANTRSQQYRSRFKKTISTLSQAAKLSQAQYGYDFAGITQTCGKKGGTEHPESTQSVCAILNGTLTGSTYFNSATDIQISKGKKYSVESPFIKNTITSMSNLSNAHAYVLSDGTIVAFSPNLGKNSCSLEIGKNLTDKYSGIAMDACAGFIDVNGPSLPNKEVSCSSGQNTLSKNNCIVKNDATYMTDIYPIRFHDGIVEPATAAARYVLKTTK